MREQARKILFNELEKSGWQWVIFNEDEPSRNSGIVECILDAMEKFKNANKHDVSSNEVKFVCRLHSMRKNCREYKNNKNSCKTCPHFVEAK
jgi:hypothetical protein